jgi:hypothetical protein
VFAKKFRPGPGDNSTFLHLSQCLFNLFDKIEPAFVNAVIYRGFDKRRKKCGDTGVGKVLGYVHSRFDFVGDDDINATKNQHFQQLMRVRRMDTVKPLRQLVREDGSP